MIICVTISFMAESLALNALSPGDLCGFLSFFLENVRMLLVVKPQLLPLMSFTIN